MPYAAVSAYRLVGAYSTPWQYFRNANARLADYPMAVVERCVINARYREMTDDLRPEIIVSFEAVFLGETSLPCRRTTGNRQRLCALTLTMRQLSV